MRDCPKKRDLHAILGSEDNDDGVQMGSLQVINALKAKEETKKAKAKGLMFVDVKIGRTILKALIDTGASHNFITAEIAKRLGLKVINGGGTMKAVNSVAKPLHGVARGVKMSIGEWNGVVDFSVATMDDFKIVLGLEFYDKVKAFLVPYSNSMYISDEGKTFMVPIERGKKEETKSLTALQIKKGLKNKDPCYLAVMQGGDDEDAPKLEIPREVRNVLGESRDVMPKELPKKLPPRREVDHATEPEAGAKPPAMVPDRMEPPELEDSRKQWKELLDAGYPRPSKAPFGAPVLSQKMKKWADKKRRPLEFSIGDKVMVKFNQAQFKSLRKVHKGLVRRYEGPFPIVARVGKAAYKLELPQRLKVHPVFHVGLLKPYHEDMEDPSRGVSTRAPTAAVTSFDREVEEILEVREVRKRGVPRSREYLIKWKGLPASEASWEAENTLWQFEDKLREFRDQIATRTSRQ